LPPSNKSTSSEATAESSSPNPTQSSVKSQSGIIVTNKTSLSSRHPKSPVSEQPSAPRSVEEKIATNSNSTQNPPLSPKRKTPNPLRLSVPTQRVTTTSPRSKTPLLPPLVIQTSTSPSSPPSSSPVNKSTSITTGVTSPSRVYRGSGKWK
jgi:hypothetical protein